MRRTGRVFDRIATFANLYEADRKARRGKNRRIPVDRFSFDLERELLCLRSDILSGRYRPGPAVEFTIADPKRRIVRAAPFRDRVLHHAILNVMEGIFERSLDPDSYACRKGKGLDAALRRAVHLSRRSAWVLKTDVEKFYASVDHGVLETLLERRLKDRRLLDLLRRIIESGGNARKGLPIGSLTSQWFANLYLDPLDRWVRSELKPRGYLRYMDDLALFSDDREELRRSLRRLRLFLEDELRLELKVDVTQMCPAARGWTFLGFCVTRAGLRLPRKSWRLWKLRFQAAYHEYRRGRRTLSEWVRSAECRLAHVRRATCEGLARRELRFEEL